MDLLHRTYAFRADEGAGDGGDDRTTIAGYGSVFGSRNSYGEVFVPGAFAQTLAEKSDAKPLSMLWLHREPIGRWTRHEERRDGLYLEGPISDTTLGRDVATLVRDRAVTGLSIGFWHERVEYADAGVEVKHDTPFGKWKHVEQAPTLYVLQASLAETSLVVAPSDDDARLSAVRERAERLLPGLKRGEWRDVAYSMALLLGGRGAGQFDELPAVERRAMYERLAAAYRALDRVPPEFDARPDFARVEFHHDERDVFADTYLRKTLTTVTTGAAGIVGPLSDETRAAAETAIDRLGNLLDPGRAERANRLADALRDLAAARAAIA